MVLRLKDKLLNVARGVLLLLSIGSSFVALWILYSNPNLSEEQQVILYISLGAPLLFGLLDKARSREEVPEKNRFRFSDFDAFDEHYGPKATKHAAPRTARKLKKESQPSPQSSP